MSSSSSDERRFEQHEQTGAYGALIEDALQKAERDGVMRRIWEKDAALWKDDPAHQKIISNALGWLTVPQWVEGQLAEVESFARDVKAAGFKHVMLLGMGGSSLCPEVLRRTFGSAVGYPELLVLDSTDPDTVADFNRRADPATTLYIVASKSGTTVEPLSFYKYFYARVREAKGDRAGENFIAITDSQTKLEQMASEANFRRTFTNPSDIGGRYSALSLFGIVPAALIGLDVRLLLARSIAATESCGANVAAMRNPAARLGCAMGAMAHAAGRDKLTIVTDAPIASLGLWIEQLIAESTGKEGTGIIPVVGEPLGTPEVYGNDRLFVYVHAEAIDEKTERSLAALEAAGHPVIRRALNGINDLCAEFFIWELATAVAGKILGIDPFDQPNVQESKDNTNALLKEYTTNGALPAQKPIVSADGLEIYTGDNGQATSHETIAAAVGAHLASVRAGDYIAVLAYIQETKEHDESLQTLRTTLRDKLHVATTIGYGPRYLHSTGQLHKGGPDSGVFLLLTDNDRETLPIPDAPYDFSTLKQAQGLGDFSSLLSHHRRAMRIHLGGDVAGGIKKITAM